MQSSRVITRFLSLLDVALILLGVLMIPLMYMQLKSQSASGQGNNPLQELADIDFVYVFVGWKGTEKDKLFLLGSNKERLQELNADKADDIRAILQQKSGPSERKNQIVMLLFSEEGWYSSWNTDRINRLEKTWNVKLLPIYNVRLPGTK